VRVGRLARFRGDEDREQLAEQALLVHPEHEAGSAIRFPNHAIGVGYQVRIRCEGEQIPVAPSLVLQVLPAGEQFFQLDAQLFLAYVQLFIGSLQFFERLVGEQALVRVGVIR
jgi:hypothetical protein